MEREVYNYIRKDQYCSWNDDLGKTIKVEGVWCKVKSVQYEDSDMRYVIKLEILEGEELSKIEDVENGHYNKKRFQLHAQVEELFFRGITMTGMIPLIEDSDFIDDYLFDNDELGLLFANFDSLEYPEGFNKKVHYDEKGEFVDPRGYKWLLRFEQRIPGENGITIRYCAVKDINFTDLYSYFCKQ